MQSSASAGLVAGDLLLNNFSGNTFQQNPNLPGNNVQEYNPLTHVLVQTNSVANGGLSWEGASVTPNGLLVTTFRTDNNGNYNPGVYLFNPNGTIASTFTTPQIVNFGAGDVTSFADGTLAVSDQGASVIRKYSQAGSYLGSIALPSSADTFGNTIDHTNNLWVADSAGKQLFHVAETGTLLNTLSLTFSPSDLSIDPIDSSLWVADQSNSTVDHLSVTGSVLGSFAVSFPLGGVLTGIAMDQSSDIFVEANNSTVIDKYNTAGLLLDSIPITNTNSQHLFMNIVPNISNNIPEPSSLCLLSIGAAGLLRRRRRVA